MGRDTGKVGRLRGVSEGARLGEGVCSLIAPDTGVSGYPDEANSMTDASEGIESINGIPDRATPGASSIECSKGRPRIGEYLHKVWAK